jgi:DNA-binding response OmpR family regulator
MRVLIAEDESALADFLQRSFAGQGDRVEGVSDGGAALERIREHAPDLLVLDLGLPVLDGVELLRTVHGSTQGMSIIVLTGRSQPSYKIDCLNLGADDYLVKPFSVAELMARSRAVQRRKAETASGFIRHGELHIDRMTRAVTFGGISIDFTAKEYTLLEYLLLQRGRAVSRQELLREVWHMSPDAGTNVVDVYVNYLRRKLGGGSAAGMIETVRGEGYAIGAKSVPSKPPVGAQVLPVYGRMAIA